MLSIRSGLMALAALVLGVSACSGGGKAASSGLPQEQLSSPSGTTSQTVTRTYTLARAAGSYELPPLGGFGGSLALPAASVPANTFLELTSSLQAPAGAPILQDAERRLQATGTLNVYFYTSIRLSFTVTFPTLPGFSLTLPATIMPNGLQFFYAISDPKPTNGAEVQFRTQGPATVSGQIVTFAPSTTPLTFNAGQPYTIAFYAISAIAATPAPTPPAGNIYVVNCGGCNRTGNNTVTTYTANGAPTTPTITGLNFPEDVAVDAAGKIYVTNNTGLDGTLTSYTANGMQTTPTITGLADPVGVAVDATGKIYVTTASTNTLTTYNADGVQTTPTITAGLDDPTGIAVDPAGKIYVANIANNTVTTYNAAGTRTTPTITGLNYPFGVAVDAVGKIYVANSGQFGTANNSVTTYDADGVQTTPTITGLNSPSEVAVDAAGKIYVTNQDNNALTTYTADGRQTTPTITGLRSPHGAAVH